MAELQSVMFHGRHFVRHLGICNPICVKLLQMMSGVNARNLKKDISVSNRVPDVLKRGIYTHTQKINFASTSLMTQLTH